MIDDQAAQWVSFPGGQVIKRYWEHYRKTLPQNGVLRMSCTHYFGSGGSRGAPRTVKRDKTGN
jgi:hypothetical protein